MTTRLKSAVSDANRADVLTAESCRYCGDLLGPFEVDHIRPLSRGGDNHRDNLGSACVSCNTQKSNLLLHEWQQWRTANGMTWPPIASHPTQPAHYLSGCQPCMLRVSALPDGPEVRELMRQIRVTPHTLDADDGRYVAHYTCPTCLTSWRCGYAVTAHYYSDCPCAYCVACRLEAAA
ncbi:HNH endonuclease [Streptosporangium sp. NPDC002721]|uniref:HNH endonuclease n=1 Tax=Streptosporangium sp. NPDC002721 TaxID=3366188 RepID=UPI0036AB4FF6